MSKLIGKCVLLLAGFMLVACSSTEMTGSWANPDFKGRVKNKKVYIVGVAKNELNKRIFEDTFSKALSGYGVLTVDSYRDSGASTTVDKMVIEKNMIKHSCDAVLLTKLVGQRKESVTNPGYVSGSSSGPYFGYRERGVVRPPYYNNWGNYYGRSFDIVYEPPTTTEFVILTVESVMYDLKTEELIWSAQFETVVEQNIEKLMQDYVNRATKDLKEKGLI